MAPIKGDFLDCSVYLFKSMDDARGGAKSGGSGFLVSYPSPIRERPHLYAVTNKHVVDNGCHVLRLNTAEGKVDCIQTQPESWFHHPDNDDLVVLPIELGKQYRFYAVKTLDFVTPGIIKDNDIGPGDEIFMIGRLVSREDRQQNTPVARFGNLSMMADRITRDYDGELQESFLIECRSLSGFSGSPVFVWPRRQGLAMTFNGDASYVTRYLGPWLLGIDWCHIPLWKPVFNKTGRDKSELPGNWVEQNTGIAGVIPAWRLLKLLDQGELMKQRKLADKEMSQELESAAIPDVAEETREQPEPFSEQVFERALKKASRKLPRQKKA